MLRQLMHTVKELGALNALLYALTRLLETTSGGRARIIRYYFMAQPLHQAPALTLRSSAKSRVRRVERGDAVTQQFPRLPAIINRRFAHGDDCFVAETDTRFAGFLWLAHEAYDEDEVRCRYELAAPSNCVWDYDVHVEPAFRSTRTFARLWSTVSANLAARGVQWSLSRISAFNPTSLAAHRRLGARKIGSASFILLGPVQIALFGQKPFIHVTSGPGRQPVLRLAPPTDLSNPCAQSSRSSDGRSA